MNKRHNTPNTSHTESSEPKFHQKWLVLASIAMGIFLGTIDGGIVNIAQPTLMRELSAPVSAVRWTVLAYMLTIAILMIPIGLLGDRIGKKKIYVTGFLVFTAASALCGIAPSLALLIFFRILQAVGAAMMTSLGMAIITESFPPRERGKALGITGTIVSIGVIAGPTIGGFMVEHFNWRSIFYVNIPIGIIGCIMAARFVREHKSQRNGPQGLKALAHNRHIFVPLGAAFLFFAVTAGLNFLLPFYFEHVLTLGSSQAGLLMGVMPIMLGILAPLSGILSDRFGSKKISLTGSSIAALGFCILVFIQQDISVHSVVWFLVPSAIGLALFQTSNYAAILSSVSKSQTGITSSFIAFSRTLGFASGVGVFSSIFSWQIGKNAGTEQAVNNPSPEVFFASIHHAFIWVAVLALVAFALAVKASSNKPHQEETP
jgi:MFS family permease